MGIPAQRSTQDLHTLIAHAPVGIFEADARGRYTFVNAAWCEMTGLTAAQALGQGWAEAIHPEDRPRVLGEWHRAVHAGERFHDEFRLGAPEDEATWADAIAEPIRSPAGDVVGFVGSLTDITERREIELALLDRDATLRSFYDGSPLVMGIVEVAGTDLLHVSQNAATAQLFGMRPEEMEHRLASEMGTPEPLLRLWMARIGEAAAAKAPVRFEFQFPVRGEERWLSATVSPIDSPHRTRPRFAYVMEDITPRKHADAQLAAQAEALARSNRELEQFAYVASHDLQEPLRTMASYAELLGERYRGRLDPDADDIIGFMVDAARRMRELVSGLLTYSRLTTERERRVRVDTQALVHAVLADLQVAARERKAVITVDPLPAVIGSPRQLRQLFQNLIGNAIKFAGDGPPRVRISAEVAGAEAIFSVSDSGIGIDPRESGRIFHIFQRLHSRAAYPGAGLGLAISRRVVEQHGGRIWFEPSPGPGGGTTFKFTLPTSG
jgi:PAS domain S-box-containing protein